MVYDWTKSAEGEGGNAVRMGNGKHAVTITKIIYSKKNQPAFKSKAGAYQIMIIFQNEAEEEVSSMFTLSIAASWTMARLLSCFNIDTDKLTEDGVVPSQFAEPEFADDLLIGLRGWIEVTNDDDGGFPEVVPIHVEADEPTQPAETVDADEGYEPIDESSIPF